MRRCDALIGKENIDMRGKRLHQWLMLCHVQKVFHTTLVDREPFGGIQLAVVGEEKCARHLESCCRCRLTSLFAPEVIVSERNSQKEGNSKKCTFAIDCILRKDDVCGILLLNHAKAVFSA